MLTGYAARGSTARSHTSVPRAQAGSSGVRRSIVMHEPHIRIHRVAVLALAFQCLLSAGQGRADDWPQLQGNPQRTGYTPQSVALPFTVAWHREFPPERICRNVQAVVYSGKVFLGTKSGNLYALDARTGKEAWKYSAGSGILHTAACADGKVVIACMDGTVRAVNADTGAEAWTFQANRWFAFSTAPLVAEGAVFIGQRQGTFYALRLKDGSLLWEFEAGEPIANSAAYNKGRVFFCDEGLYVHCLDADNGKEVWTSEKLYGQSAKQYHPVICEGYVLLRPMMTHPTREYYNSNYGKDPADRVENLFQATWAHFDYWTGKTDKPKAQDVQTPYSDWFRRLVPEVKAGKMPQELQDAAKQLVEHYRRKPYDQDLFILDERTGKQAFIAPHFATFSLPGPVPPPVADGRGGVVIPWIFVTQCWARLDLRQRGIVQIILPQRAQNGDNNSNFSMAGNQFFNAHMCGGHHHHGSFDLDARTFHAMPRAPGYWGQLSDACESGGNSAAIANGFIYHVNYHQVTAWATGKGADQ